MDIFTQGFDGTHRIINCLIDRAPAHLGVKIAVDMELTQQLQTHNLQTLLSEHHY
jgi:hypothetical protein